MMVGGMVFLSSFVLFVTAVVGFLYWLTPPKRRLLISSILIWQRFLVARKQVFDRKKWVISLLLALLIAHCLGLAFLSEKYGKFIGLDNRVVILLDNSSSMATFTSDGETRYQKAVKIVKEIISKLDMNARVMVMDTQGLISSPDFDLPREAINVVDRLKLGASLDSGTSMLNLQIHRDLEGANYYYVSDGVSISEPEEFWEIISVFEESDNIGITEFDVDTVPGSPESQKAFVTLLNGGITQQKVELRIKGVGSADLIKEITLEPTSSASYVFDISEFDEGPITARVSAERDGFAIDDVAHSFRRTNKRLRVGLVSSEGRYFSSLLNDYPNAAVTEFSPVGFEYAGNIDLYIFDGMAPQEPPRVPALVVNGIGPWLPAGTPVFDPEIIFKEQQHPILQQVSLDDVFIDVANQVQISNDETSLLALDTNLSILVANNRQPRWVWLGFDLNNSNFGRHSSFPVFLDNIIHWLMDVEMVSYAGLGPVRVRFPGDQIIGVDGSFITPTSSGLGYTQFFATKPGIYTMKSKKNNQLKIVVNALDTRMTSINATRFINDNGSLADKGGLFSQPNMVLWLLLGVLVLLLCEWVTYNFRKTV